MVKLTKDKVTFSKWDGSELLRTEEDIRLAIKAALEDYNDEAFKLLLKDIIKARSRMSETAKATKIPRTTLYRQLSAKGDLTFKNFVKIGQSLGFSLF